MSAVPAVVATGSSVDLAFRLAGTTVSCDYATPLWEALRANLPWLDDEPDAGVHPLKGVTASSGLLFLGHRARLTLRLARERVSAARALCGRRLALGGEVEVGEPGLREFALASAQYSSLVALDSADEGDFVAQCRRRLQDMAIECELVCGRAQEKRVDDHTALRGYSVLLHGLSEEAALRLQARGLGKARKLGCGLFVAHKSVAAVGA
jgi:CRISPR-associated protein Cas6